MALSTIMGTSYACLSAVRNLENVGKRMGADLLLNFRELRKSEVQLRRTPLPRTPVNEVMKKGRDPLGPRPCSLSSAPCLLAHQLVLSLIHQPLLLFPLPFFCCSGLLLLPCLRHGSHLLHRPKEVILWPLLNKLATLVKAVDLDATHLDMLASPTNAEELPLMSTTGCVAGYHLVPFSYLILHRVGEIWDGVTEVLYLSLYGICSPYLSRFTVGVVADEVGVEDLRDHLYVALTEGLLHQAACLFLVLFRHIEVSFPSLAVCN